ncbi:hypothetical protein VY361_002582 [Enterococcus faecium]|uniref:glycosyltransferase n=1 Tax=Enterococcus faecium TaxID=1352 RepID=UPI001BCE6BE6|nr:glycosyltransferase [Enterococcus faecium]EME5422582.1 hypothetical protein [Enterococcus faecium]
MSIDSKKQINIMTSCDEYYFEYLFNQVINASKTQENYVNFFFLYSRVAKKKIVKLIEFCKNLENLSFFPIEVTENISDYNALAQHGGVTANSNQLFPFEIYFQLNAYEYLPEWVDRILVIHAGDIMFVNDVSDYYFSDFNDKLVTLELTNYLISDDRTSVNTDLYKVEDREYFINKHQGKEAYFNSGVVLLNVGKQRENNRGLTYYLDILETMKKIIHTKSGVSLFIGDQSFYSVAYLGEVNIFNGISETKRNHRRNNYSHYSYKKDLSYGYRGTKPISIFHFDGLYKPWLFSKSILNKVKKTRLDVSYEKGYHKFAPAVLNEYFVDFWEYDSFSPYHEEHLYNAKINEKIWSDFYLPLMNSYVKEKE